MKFSDPYSNIVQMNILPGMQVADFGSGIGFYSLGIAKVLDGKGAVYAIDIQSDHLSKLKKEATHRGYENLEIIHSDLEKLNGSGLLGGTIDRVVVSNVLFQVHDPSVIAKEVYRVLKPSGLVAVIDWVESFNQIGPHANQIHPSLKIIDIFEKAGFEIMTRLDSGSHHYGYIFKRKSIQINSSYGTI